MMVLAGLLSLCSTSDAFIAANFLTFPVTTKLAFMVFGPMMDMKLLFMYGLVFKKRFTFSLRSGCLSLSRCFAWRSLLSYDENSWPHFGSAHASRMGRHPDLFLFQRPDRGIFASDVSTTRARHGNPSSNYGIVCRNFPRRRMHARS